MTDSKMEAEIIFEPHIPDALRRALEYAGDDGFVAPMPQLLHARANASYDNIIWNTWFTANSEESVVTTPQGNRVVVVVHGGGIFASPERFERVYRAPVDYSSPEGLTRGCAGKITEREAHDVLEGKLPDGTEIPVYSFDEFKQGIQDLPRRHAVIMDIAMVRKSKSGYELFDVLKDEPFMIVRAGGVAANAAYLDKFRDRYNTKVMGNYHPFNRVDLRQPQTRITFLAGNMGGVASDDDDFPELGYDCEYGMGGYAAITGMARYVAVAPRDVSMNFRDLNFGA